MKKRLYLVRHGEKVRNIGDPPLTEKGILQAKDTGIYFKNQRLQKIIASPSLRTRQTAEIIADALALEVTFSDLLKERANWGDNPIQDYETFLAMWQRASINRDWTPQVGDSSRIAGERLNKLIKSLNNEASQIILVTHAGTIADFLRNIFDDKQLDAKYLNFSQLKDDGILDCSITILDFDTKTGKYKLITLASIKHLSEI